MTIPAYPLQWPEGWPRTAAHQRARAKFARYQWTSTWRGRRELTVEEAVRRVRAELERMGIYDDDLVISTNLTLRVDGWPRSGQREPDDPGAAVYWRTPAGEPRCMAIDRYGRVADNLAAIAATLGAMRAIERHGGAEVLDRAFSGFTALPSPTAAGAPWYVVLDVSPDADHDEIERAYRALRSQFHPDRGGDAETFRQVQDAWEHYLRARG